MIEIDGSLGEGGGQILRSSLALSLCTGRALRVSRIRAGRAKPGLMRQHLTCVQAAARVGAARVEGAEPGSGELVFVPGGLHAGEHAFAVGTAGSCTLVLQTVWPALMLADGPSRLRLSGGTHNPMAPPFHFVERCYAPLLRRLGADATLSLRRLGFHPAGGGEIEAVIQPAGERLAPVDLLERGAPVEAWAECLAPGLPRAVARRELDALGRALGWTAAQLREGAVRQNEGPGNALLATLAHEHVTELVSALGERGRSSEDVAAGLAREVRAYQAGDGALGPHLADQWALPLAIAIWKRGGRAAYTCTELTMHATTNFEVIARFLPVRFSTTAQGSGWRVDVERVD